MSKLQEDHPFTFTSSICHPISCNVLRYHNRELPREDAQTIYTSRQILALALLAQYEQGQVLRK